MKIKKLAALLLALTALTAFFSWQNNGIVITNLDYMHAQIPDAFHGFRIVQVSDLHNKEFGRGNAHLLAKISAAEPDILVITGDLIDSRRTNINVAAAFATEAVEIAPVYFVAGNHEQRSGIYGELKSRLEAAGVTVLDNQGIELEKGKDSLAILGLADPDFIDYPYEYLADNRNGIFAETLAQVAAEHQGKFTVLLSHRPEKMSLYAWQEIDLVFAGHAHGGQFRLPLIGGLAAPNQGLFPKYTSGMYEKDGTAMIVSRGLGNSIFPLRLFNRPELVVVTLKRK